MINNNYVVFVLEDSPYQRNQIVDTLKRCDRKILFADSIREAKDIYKTIGSDIDLFILDLKLPDGNGMDFLQYMRNSSNTSPIIITSATITDKIREKAKELKVNTFFEKRDIMDNLEQAVRGALHA